MGIVSSAKDAKSSPLVLTLTVSIPDGDSFLREASFQAVKELLDCVSIPDGDSFLREDR